MKKGTLIKRAKELAALDVPAADGSEIPDFDNPIWEERVAEVAGLGLSYCDLKTMEKAAWKHAERYKWLCANSGKFSGAQWGLW